MSNDDGLAEGQAFVNQIMDYTEEVYLKGQALISTKEPASIADIACYEGLLLAGFYRCT